MPSIKRTKTTQTYDKLQASAKALSDHNMCAVIAVAALTEKPYDEVAALFLEMGRQHRRGTPVHISEKVIEKLGFKRVRIHLDDVIAGYPAPHCNVLKNVTTHHPRRFGNRFPAGKLLARSRGHMLAIIDGEVQDWSINQALRLITLHRIEPIEKADQDEAKVAKRLAGELWAHLNK